MLSGDPGRRRARHRGGAERLAADGAWTMEVATTDMDGNNPYMLAFAQDADGEVYALTSITTGPIDSDQDTIYKIVPAE